MTHNNRTGEIGGGNRLRFEKSPYLLQHAANPVDWYPWGEEAFAKARRDLSNGCVRLEDAQRFGRWLLGREPVAPSAEPEQFVQLPKGIPIYLTYLTAQPVDGKIVYTTDIYGRDTHGVAQASAGSASHDRTSAN